MSHEDPTKSILDFYTSFCASWLASWTGNQSEKLLSFYHEDAFYRDPAKPDGLWGHQQLRPYFEKLLARNPDWVWKTLQIFPTEKGFALKWEAKIPVVGETVTETGMDIVEIKDQKIIRNEVYFDTSRLKIGATGLLTYS